MVRRQNRIHVVTTDLQGDDSYVIVTLPTVGEIKSILLHEGQNLESFEDGARIIRNHVFEWNWVDDDGNPLPTPKDDPAVVETLTTEEYRGLIALLMGGEGERKN